MRALRLIGSSSASSIALILLCACATTQTISEADRRNLRTVNVAREVAMPAYPLVYGSSAQKAGFFLGPLGLASAMSSDADDAVQFSQYLASQKIDIPEIVREEFTTQLSWRRAFGEVVDAAAPADATLHIAVENYGLGFGFSMSPMNKPVRPTLKLSAKLVHRDGQVLWQGSEFITGMSDLPSYPIEEYYSRDGLLKESFGKATKLVVEGMLKELPGLAAPAHAATSVTAAIAPATPVSSPALAALPASMPRPGDLWRYRYVDGFSGRSNTTVVHEVVAIKTGEIDEKMYLASQSAFVDERNFTSGGVGFVLRPLPKFERAEFAPYLQTFRPDLVSGPPQTIGSISGDTGTWEMKGRVIGSDVVQTPAGRFEAVKVEVTGERPGRSLISEPVRVQHVIWYAPKVKRYVRYEVNSWSGNGFQREKDRFELVEFKLN